MSHSDQDIGEMDKLVIRSAELYVKLLDLRHELKLSKIRKLSLLMLFSTQKGPPMN